MAAGGHSPREESSPGPPGPCTCFQGYSTGLGLGMLRREMASGFVSCSQQLSNPRLK